MLLCTTLLYADYLDTLLLFHRFVTYFLQFYDLVTALVFQLRELEVILSIDIVDSREVLSLPLELLDQLDLPIDQTARHYQHIEKDDTHQNCEVLPDTHHVTNMLHLLQHLDLLVIHLYLLVTDVE